MIRISSRRNQRSGASLVEFAFVAPVLLLVLIGVLEYARFLFTLQLLNNAAREGARYAAVNTSTLSTAAVQTYVDTYLAGQGANQLVGYSPTSNISIYQADPTTGLNTGLSWQNASFGTAIGVSISGTYHPITPVFLKTSSNLSITGSCVIAVESN